MNVWLVLLIVAVVLSPLAWLVPSRGQLGSMDVRQQARRMGLSMQLSREEWPHWFERTVSGSCAQFYLERRGASSRQWCYWQVEPGRWLDKWREPCLDPGLVAQLSLLPADVYKAEAGLQLVSVYWSEKSGVEMLPRIRDFLRQWV